MKDEEASRKAARRNFFVEVVALFFLFGALAIVVVMMFVILIATSAALNGRKPEEISEIARMFFDEGGYLQLLMTLSIPIFLIIISGIGLRRILLRPDPPPDPLWEPEVPQGREPESPP